MELQEENGGERESGEGSKKEKEKKRKAKTRTFLRYRPTVSVCYVKKYNNIYCFKQQ